MYHSEYSVHQIQHIIQAEGIIPLPNTLIRTLAFDSRKLSDEHHTLFFALNGRRNGEAYIKEAYNKGLRNFVVRHNFKDSSSFPDANFLQVENPLEALQMLATAQRRLFDRPVIAITGSNGKTIVKEWLYQLLGHYKRVIRSPKSYNSQIGVPISVWNIGEDHDLAIIEAGISLKDEMDALAGIIQPTIGVLTNIGEAHNEGFASKEAKLKEKLKLFADVDLFVYSPKYMEGIHPPGRRQFSWAFKQTADLCITRQDDNQNNGTTLTALFKEREMTCNLPFKDAASIENVVCCWAVLLALDYDPHIVVQWLEKLHTVNMRMELKKGIHNCSVIDDSYSLDLSSLGIALDFLNQQKQHSKKTLILSDIPETGIPPRILYQQVADLLRSKQVDRLIGVGDDISAFSSLFQLEKQFFTDTQSLLSAISDIALNDEAILLKGARKFKFEHISKILTQKVHETILEINLSALEANLNHYKAKLKPGVKLMAMVKAFSYGSGSYEIANILQFNRVDYLAVAYADEGVSLRQAGITLPIMVMNPDVDGFETMIENDLEPEIYSLRVMNSFFNALSSANRTNYPVHIKLDTGMHRLGFAPEEIEALLALISEDNRVTVKSAFSHLTSSEDDSSDHFTRQQIDLFSAMTSKLESTLGYSIIKHIANTSAISRLPEAQFDMVRLGIGLYGIDSSHSLDNSALETVARLVTCVSQIKELRKGDTVGYNRRGVMMHDGKVATVKIGYADGYNRKLGNGIGHMLINGHLVPTIGSICMDMCMLDVTDIPVEEGDEVIVFDSRHTVSHIARQLETIPYEILTGISQRVKRVYYYE